MLGEVDGDQNTLHARRHRSSFRRSDGDDRKRDVAHHLFRDASKEPSPYAFARMGPHDDQIGRTGVYLLQDGFVGATASPHSSLADIAQLSQTGRLLLQRSARVRFDLFEKIGQQIIQLTKLVLVRRDRVEQMKLRAMGFRERKR